MKDTVETIAVVGQGYVGLPLALAFSKKYPVLGYDVNKERIAQLQTGLDCTQEVSFSVLQEALELGEEKPFKTGIRVTSDINDLKEATIFIITVPTPIDEFNSPDLSFLVNASQAIAGVIKKGAVPLLFVGCLGR